MTRLPVAQRLAAAAWRGRVDVALGRLMFDALLRRSKVAALTWADVVTETDGSGWVTVRHSKTDQTGEDAVARLYDRGQL